MSAVMQLGYLAFEVRDVAAWQALGTDILGLALVDDRGAEGFSLRMDRHHQRFFIESGEADDLAAIGWQVDGAGALEQIARRLRDSGHAVSDGSAKETARRNVAGLVHFKDPAGHPGELYYGPKMASEPFESDVVRSGFVADEQGLGHVVVASKNQDEHEAFYSDMLGLKLSDYIRCEYFGHEIDVTFMHANPRHHSFAFGKGRDKRMHHFMVQARAIDEVGLCYDRFLFSGGMLHQTLGRHPNDRMFSFYGNTPSGFHFEFGYGGVQIDDATWKPVTHGVVSEWGHHPPHLLTKAFRKAKQQRQKTGDASVE